MTEPLARGAAATDFEVPAALAGRVVRPEDRGYPLLRSTYMRTGSPSLVIRPERDEEVSSALEFVASARRDRLEPVPFSIRSGGHGISGSGTNDGGIVLDLSRMRSIELLDAASGRFVAEAGATWGDVGPMLAPHDLALSTGNFGDTGVGGLATAGGVGFLARSQGLTIDHVKRVKLATPDGAVRWVDASHEPDLFWAVRGGMTQVGVALAFEFVAPRIGSSTGRATILSQELQYLVPDLPAFTVEWGEWIAAAPREAESFLMIQRTRDGQAVVHARTVWANDAVDDAMPTLRDAEALGQVLYSQAHAVPYPAIVLTPRQPHTGQQERINMRNVLVDSASADVGLALEESLADPVTILAELRSLGGAVSDVAPSATAWAGRHQQAIVATWTQNVGVPRVDESFAPLQAVGTGTYAAYSSDTRASAAELAWPGEAGERLRALAARVDPGRVFDQGVVLGR